MLLQEKAHKINLVNLLSHRYPENVTRLLHVQCRIFGLMAMLYSTHNTHVFSSICTIISIIIV